jgi:DNA primase
VHLQQAGFDRRDITDAGLAFVNRVNKLQDQFRGRLMFPIYDSRGEPVGFGGRALADQVPKYKNSPETPIYRKSGLLYGLNWAKGEIVARGEAIVCEGYTDVMAFALAGVPNAVATCGTAVTDEHVQVLKNLARRVVLAFDADSAGQAAADRWYQWEHSYEIEVRVADLPAGRDPADVWRDDRSMLPRAVERAQRFLQFKLERALGNADLSTPEGRARAAEAVVPVLREHPSELVREGYIQEVAGRIGVEHAWFKDAIARSRTPGRVERATTSVARPASAISPVDRRETDVLRWAIHEPHLVADWLDASLFSDTTARAAFEHLVAADSFRDALDTSEGAVRSLLERLAVEEPVAEADTQTIRTRLMINMAEPAAKQLLGRLLEKEDARATKLRALLDDVAHSREVTWTAAQEAAEQLVTLTVTWSRDGGGG